jgi:hypothetical protein
VLRVVGDAHGGGGAVGFNPLMFFGVAIGRRVAHVFDSKSSYGFERGVENVAFVALSELSGVFTMRWVTWTPSIMTNFLNSAFAAIPHVVGDTRALIAYVVAVAGWIAVALKVQRNKNLLLHLKQLPDSDRLRALQMEMGAVPVPEGMTPTQFLAVRLQTYYFWAFVIFCVLLASIAALALTYQSHSVGDISHQLQDAMAKDRAAVAADAPNKKTREEETKVETLQLRMVPDYYIQQFGQPSDKGKDKSVTYFEWINDLYELDMSFVNGRSTEYCLISQSEKFKPLVPGTGDEGTPVHLGEKPLSALATEYVWSNFGSSGGSTVAHYGLDGSHAEDGLYEYIAYAASKSDYPKIKDSDKLPDLKASSQNGDTNTAAGNEAVNAFAVTTLGPSPHGPLCLQLPLWEPWK